MKPTQDMIDWFVGGDEEAERMVSEGLISPDLIVSIWGQRKELLDRDPREVKQYCNHRRDRCARCGKLTYNSLQVLGAVERPGFRCFCCRDEEMNQ